MEPGNKIIELGSSDRRISALERKVRKVLELDPADRMRAILSDNNAAELVQAMPPQELLITVKQTGEMDSLPLLEMASPEQIRFLADVEWWKGDNLDADRILYWLALFADSGEHLVLKWLRSVDPEFLITILGKFLRVSKPDDGLAGPVPPDAGEPFTIDGVYHLYFRDDESFRIIGRVLRIFAAERMDLYQRIMEGMVWELGAETEELAGRWRNGRLRDRGIPDLDEAMEIYAYLDTRRPDILPPKESPQTGGEEEVPPSFPLKRPGDERMLFLEAMEKIRDPKTLDGIGQEISHLVNRVLVADRMDLADPEAIYGAAQKVRATLSLGLEVLAPERDTDRAAEILRTKWLIHIFRAGHSRALYLARRAHRMSREGWLARAPRAVKLLGEPLERIFIGLKRKRPGYYTGTADGYRHFASTGEIEEARRALDKIDYLGKLFFERLRLVDYEPDSWTFDNIYPVDITFETVLRTAFVNAAARGEFEYKPVTADNLREVLKNAFEEDPDKRGRKRIKRQVRRNMIEYLEGRDTAADDSERAVRDEFVARCLETLEDELGRLDPEQSPDPRFIQGIVLGR